MAEAGITENPQRATTELPLLRAALKETLRWVWQTLAAPAAPAPGSGEPCSADLQTDPGLTSSFAPDACPVAPLLLPEGRGASLPGMPLQRPGRPLGCALLGRTAQARRALPGLRRCGEPAPHGLGFPVPEATCGRGGELPSPVPPGLGRPQNGSEGPGEAEVPVGRPCAQAVPRGHLPGPAGGLGRGAAELPHPGRGEWGPTAPAADARPG